ncbi:MAG TPA: hypothetical protein VGH42_05255 [Verrucomicrobiae bacterium]|jgi:hypothetical protein
MLPQVNDGGRLLAAFIHHESDSAHANNLAEKCAEVNFNLTTKTQRHEEKIYVFVSCQRFFASQNNHLGYFNFMRKITVLIFVAIIVAFFAFYIVKQQKRQHESQAIVNVWNQLPAAIESSKVMPRKSAKGEQPQLDLMQLADKLTKVDCSQCPADFQAAWLHMVKAETEIAVHANTATAVVAVLDAMKGNGSAISAANERQADFNAAVLECKQVASQYGVKFPS